MAGIRLIASACCFAASVGFCVIPAKALVIPLKIPGCHEHDGKEHRSHASSTEPEQYCGGGGAGADPSLSYPGVHLVAPAEAGGSSGGGGSSKTAGGDRTDANASVGKGLVASLLASSVSSAPSSNSSSSSGGAPSPEVNTLLGFILIAGTVAFIKRRQHDEAATEDPTA